MIANSLKRIAILGGILSIGICVGALGVPSEGPQCEVKGTGEITISCIYSPTAAAEKEGTAPRVVLNHTVISFTPSSESHMHVELTFTNASDTNIAEKRTVYLAFDDAKGENHMRRPLPHVDFTKIEPGKPMTFEETLLALAFEPGMYSISLWIPSNDTALKFERAHNFLLSDEGVPDTESGLNRIKKFTATQSSRRRKSAPPD